MRTIDNLKFPRMDDKQPVSYFCDHSILLPNGIIIPSFTTIKLSHTGIKAVVEFDGKKFEF